MKEKLLNQEYWNELYKAKETGWDIGYPSPAIKAYIDQLSDKTTRILIPGCGNGYEAGYLLLQGFTNITLIDIAPDLTTALKEKFKEHIGGNLTVITGDFFEHEGKYDLVLEQTFLSALPPAMRNAYAKKMWSLLHPGGRLAGVLFNKNFEEGPPFGGSEDEYKTLFGNLFHIHTLSPCYNSIERRADSEVFINLRAKAE